MDRNNSVNIAQNNLNISTIHVNHEVDPEFQQDVPPPYSPRNETPEGNQPVIHQTIIVQPTIKGKPVFLSCPHCETRILTNVVFTSTKTTHLLAGFIGGLTLWCMLCCLAAVPYYVNTFKKAEHYCPNCNTLLGTNSVV